MDYRCSPPLRGQWFSGADPRPVHHPWELARNAEPRAHPDPESQKLGGLGPAASWEGPMQAGVRGEEESEGACAPRAPSPRWGLHQSQRGWEAQTRSRSCSKDGEWSPEPRPGEPPLSPASPLPGWSRAGRGTVHPGQAPEAGSSLLPPAPAKATTGLPLSSSPESGGPPKRTIPDQPCLNAGKASRMEEACSPAKRRCWLDSPWEAGRADRTKQPARQAVPATCVGLGTSAARAQVPTRRSPFSFCLALEPAAQRAPPAGAADLGPVPELARPCV